MPDRIIIIKRGGQQVLTLNLYTDYAYDEVWCCAICEEYPGAMGNSNACSDEEALKELALDLLNNHPLDHEQSAGLNDLIVDIGQ